MAEQKQANKKNHGGGWITKKTLMVALLCMMGLLWGRLLLQHVPRTSVANDGVATNAQDASAGTPAKVESPVESMVDLGAVAPIERDPFDFEPNRYKRTELPGLQPQKVGGGEQKPDLNSDLEKARAELAFLDIQSIVDGQPAKVMVNGRILGLGDTINGFDIVAIDYRNKTVDFKRGSLVFRKKP